MTIHKAILSVRERIEIARSAAGRQDTVRLIGISKTHPAKLIHEAWDAGLMDFGENRVQEALPKIAASEPSIIWHLVGHLQSNKAGKAAQVFDWVHSLDSVETVGRLHHAARAAGRRIRALVEVNTSGEKSKHGIAPADAASFMARAHEALAEAADGKPESGVVISGLMTIGPLGGSDDDNRRAFALLREIRDRLRGEWPLCAQLSMGMSGDFESAILEGATMVRVGSAIFGAREA